MDKKHFTYIFFTTALALNTTACMTGVKYQQYDYQYYKYKYINKQDRAIYKKNLGYLLGVVPDKKRYGNTQITVPGVYTEYGMLLLEDGDRQGAIKYFLMEKRLWPESKDYIDRLIRKIKQGG